MADLDELLGEKPRDDKGRFAPVTPTEIPEPTPDPVVVAPPKEAPAPSVPPPDYVPKAALIAEREKRQALERWRAEQEHKASQVIVDPNENLTGHLDQRFDAMRSEISQQAMDRFYDAVESAARTRYADYDQKREIFLEAAQNDPSLVLRMKSERDPAEFVYKESLRLEELKDVGGDILKYKEKIRKQVMEEMQTQSKPAIPTSLNGSPSPVQTPTYQGAPALNSILRNKF